MDYNLYRLFGEINDVAFKRVVNSLKSKGYTLVDILEGIEGILDGTVVVVPGEPVEPEEPTTPEVPTGTFKWLEPWEWN